MKTISVLGLGYVGLPTAVLFADAGFEVTGFDINTELINSINNDTYKSEEPNINNLLRKVRIQKTFSCKNSLKKANIYIICVPTPKKDNKSDLKAIYKSIDLIAEVIENNSLVIIESTIPIGTTRHCAVKLLNKRDDLDKRKIFFVIVPKEYFQEMLLMKLKK